MEIKTLYLIIAVLFFMACAGTLTSMIILLPTSNIGNVASGVASAGINFFFGWLVLKMRKQQSAMALSKEEFDEVFKTK